ncbi:MAG: thioredoxin-dependent thiol peroxidase [Alphaproteobacteria bacterium]|nr:thioredoxin-dependent thiol peroxidase [Alphaproteobacteria bacterium]
MTQLEIGNKAPDFSLPADNINGGGKTYTLNNFKGKNLVLYFYPKDDTSGCTKQAIAFTENLEEFEVLNCAVFGVSKDAIKAHDKFIDKHQLKIPLLSDPDTVTCQAYGVWVEKSMYGRKYMGVERSTFLIDASGNISNIWRKVKVPNHEQEVLNALKG